MPGKPSLAQPKPEDTIATCLPATTNGPPLNETCHWLILTMSIFFAHRVTWTSIFPSLWIARTHHWDMNLKLHFFTVGFLTCSIVYYENTNWSKTFWGCSIFCCFPPSTHFTFCAVWHFCEARLQGNRLNEFIENYWSTQKQQSYIKA